MQALNLQKQNTEKNEETNSINQKILDALSKSQSPVEKTVDHSNFKNLDPISLLLAEHASSKYLTEPELKRYFKNYSGESQLENFAVINYFVKNLRKDGHPEVFGLIEQMFEKKEPPKKIIEYICTEVFGNITPAERKRYLKQLSRDFAAPKSLLLEKYITSTDSPMKKAISLPKKAVIEIYHSLEQKINSFEKGEITGTIAAIGHDVYDKTKNAVKSASRYIGHAFIGLLPYDIQCKKFDKQFKNYGYYEKKRLIEHESLKSIYLELIVASSYIYPKIFHFMPIPNDSLSEKIIVSGMMCLGIYAGYAMARYIAIELKCTASPPIGLLYHSIKQPYRLGKFVKNSVVDCVKKANNKYKHDKYHKKNDNPPSYF